MNYRLFYFFYAKSFFEPQKIQPTAFVGEAGDDKVLVARADLFGVHIPQQFFGVSGQFHGYIISLLR